MEKILAITNDALFMEQGGSTLLYTYACNIGKLDLATNVVILERHVLEKSGKYRQCLVVGDKIYIKAFCDLHEFSAKTLEPRTRAQNIWHSARLCEGSIRQAEHAERYVTRAKRS